MNFNCCQRLFSWISQRKPFIWVSDFPLDRKRASKWDQASVAWRRRAIKGNRKTEWGYDRLNAIALSVWMNKSTDARLKTSHADLSTFVKGPTDDRPDKREWRTWVRDVNAQRKKTGSQSVDSSFPQPTHASGESVTGRGGEKKKIHLLLPKHWRALVRRAQAGIESSHVHSVCTTTGTNMLSSGECCVRDLMCELVFGRRWWGDGAPKSQQGDE